MKEFFTFFFEVFGIFGMLWLCLCILANIFSFTFIFLGLFGIAIVCGAASTIVLNEDEIYKHFHSKFKGKKK